MTVPKASQDRPLVSFALFAYNQEQYIREAIEGAFSQTYEPLEIILSDDCSSDKTFAIMQEMAAVYRGPHEVRVRRNTKNVGLAGHINEIVACSTGEIICWAAGDDISMAERTMLLVEPMLLDENVSGTHSPVIRMDIDGRTGKEWYLPHMTSKFTKEDVVEHCRSVSSQSHAFRSRIFNHFGPLRLDLTNEGAPMTFRELEFGEIKFIETPTVYYRIGTGVSTYSGSDLKKVKSSEPAKIVRWRLSAYRQMLDDFQLMKFKNPILESKIQQKIESYSILLSINEQGPSLKYLIKGLSLRNDRVKVIRSYARSILPASLYRIVKRLR